MNHVILTHTHSDTIGTFQHQLELKEKEIAELQRKVVQLQQQFEEKKKSEADKEAKVQRLCQQLQQKEREHSEKKQEIQKYKQRIQEKEKNNGAKEQEIKKYLQDKEKAEAEKEQKYQCQLQEKDRELQEKNNELQEKERELLHQQQVWVIDKDEVILTREELGRGSYGIVNAGTFRGLRVAVKSLHNAIVSEFNLALFSREMSIASLVRHPNLVQFIGATKVGNPLILMELMNNSLYAELQKNQLTRQQILSIAQDVALGLNYLHLFKPQPIIHRDVSSPNVLLKPCTGPAGYKAKVSDYGSTVILQQATSTGTGMPGRSAYAAPEASIPVQHSPAMDVYSYSVLLMEITLHSPPKSTTAERERQSCNVFWSPMKSLIQRGLNTTRQCRPTMSQVIESLREIKV